MYPVSCIAMLEGNLVFLIVNYFIFDYDYIFLIFTAMPQRLF